MNNNNVSITGLSLALVFAALYNAARPQGMGFLHYNPTPATEAEGEKYLEKHKYADYVLGRVMKVDFENAESDGIETWGYDRDNGEGAVKRVIDSLRETGDPNNPVIQAIHTQGVRDAQR